MPGERVTFGTAPRVLDGRLHLPAVPQHGGAVVCHPHPEYGGAMDVPLVVRVTEALAARGATALRFDFGGVGESGGRSTGGVEEPHDVAAAVAALSQRIPAAAPLAVVGYSFGAWVGTIAAADTPRVSAVVAIAPPLAHFDWSVLPRLRVPFFVVVGTRDALCPATTLEDLEVRCGGPVVVTRIAGADHFFGGHEDEVAFAACAHLGLA